MKKSGTDWGAHILQVALFSNEPFPSSLDVYSELLGVAPDSTENRPKEGILRQMGVLDGVQIQIAITPLRLDIAFSPSQEPLSLDADDVRVSMGPFTEELEKFAGHICSWISNLNVPLVRLSFIGVAIAEAPSTEGAYLILSKNLKSLKVTPKMTDLSYRVNWKAATRRLPEGYLNRLTTWSSFKLELRAGMGPIIKDIAAKYFARLDLDINTPAERATPLPKADLREIVSELFGLGAENIANGECQ